MRPRVLAALALGLLLAPPGAGAAASLETRLDAALRHRGLRGARIAVLVVGRDDGRLVYARDPDRALVPASNLKILTALAALAAFGPAHRFTTEVYADAPLDAEGVVSLLAIRGGGDPALTSEDLWRLAADLRRMGLRKVRGDLLLDDTAFDGEHWHPGWGRISSRAYHAPVGALSVNYGAFAVVVEGGAHAGKPVRVAIDPPIPFFRVSNRAHTGPPRARRTLVVDREPAEAFEHVIVSGRMPAASEPKVYHRSVLDAARYAGAVFRMQLEANGIAVSGATRVSPVPPAATLLLSFEGKALAEVVRLFVKFSNNAIAEGLVKAMGARHAQGPATWKDGLAAMRAELASLGLAVDQLKIADGSGLSYENRVSPRSLVEALRLGHRSFRFGPEFVAALPIAAADGTLEERAEEAAMGVRAKTGLLTRVTGLSGYARRSDGVVAFSVLVNGFRGSAEAAMDGVDGFVAALVKGEEALAAQDLRAR